ncbi:MAG: P1 family peptidase [Anaerolineae bacterium]
MPDHPAHPIRARDLGIPFEGEPGTLNAITDVSGVQVGHETLISGDGALHVGEGPVRTGVTVILPRGRTPDPVFAGWFALNGNGEMTGTTWVEESGFLEGIIGLTNTHSVGVVRDALVRWQHEHHFYDPVNPGIYWIMPVVAETYDGFLNDINGQHVKPEHVYAALDRAQGGAVDEGCVGGGTGMICHEFKGGIGTASRRVLEGRFTVGALVQTNYGERAEMMMYGVPLGAHLLDDHLPQPGPGSIMMVIATDAPLDARQLTRCARRAAIALGRTGTVSHDGSGEFAIAFSTANRWSHDPADPVEAVTRIHDGRAINEMFLGVVEALEEAIWNAVVAAETMTGRDGNTLYALPHEAIIQWFDYYRRRTP